MTMRVPWTSLKQVGVSIVAITPIWGALPRPPAVLQGTLSVTNGVVTVALPKLADGEVYAVTIDR
jgi:hypothetical protein